MKICPVCESTLFDDMDTCFGCLYRFGSDPALEAARSANGSALARRWRGGGVVLPAGAAKAVLPPPPPRR